MACGCQSPAGARARRTECRTGAWRGSRASSGRTASGRPGRGEPELVEQLAEAAGRRQQRRCISSAVAAAGTGARPTGIAVSSIVSRIAATARAVGSPDGSASARSASSIRPPGNTRAPAGKGHAARRARPSAARAAGGAVAHHDQGRGRDRVVAHRVALGARPAKKKAAGVIAGGLLSIGAAYMPLTFCSSASARVGRVVELVARHSRIELRRPGCRARRPASLAASLASALSSSALGWFISALLTCVLVLAAAAGESERCGANQRRKSSLFIVFSSPERIGLRDTTSSQRHRRAVQWPFALRFRAKSLSKGVGATGYVGRVSGGIGISDPGGSTPAPPPPAAVASRIRCC